MDDIRTTSPGTGSYEPPKIEELGPLVEMTAGTGTPGREASGASI